MRFSLRGLAVSLAVRAKQRIHRYRIFQTMLSFGGEEGLSSRSLNRLLSPARPARAWDAESCAKARDRGRPTSATTSAQTSAKTIKPKHRSHQAAYWQRRTTRREQPRGGRAQSLLGSCKSVQSQSLLESISSERRQRGDLECLRFVRELLGFHRLGARRLVVGR